MNYEKLRRQLLDHEGMVLKPYRDTVGKLTIGIGRNLADRGISEEEALFLLENDIEMCVADLNKALPWWTTLSEARQHVLLDMCFNLGIGRLLGFKNTLVAVRDGNYEKAARGMLASLWAKQVGRRAFRLATMMREG